MDGGRPTICAPWPLKCLDGAALAPAETHRAVALAERHLRDHPNLATTVAFGGGLSAGCLAAPTLFLEDHRAIHLLPPEKASQFEYRSLGLAGAGDLFLISRKRVPAFERYVSAQMGSTPDILTVDRGNPAFPAPLAFACLHDAAALTALVDAAAASGGLNICPFISTGHVWRLGAEIARRSGKPVRVMGPPPRIARRANDKLWFTAQVRHLLGRDAAPPTYSAFGPAAAAALLCKIARQHERAVVKLPSSAGSMGNVVLDAALVRGRSGTAVRELLLGRLHDIGWPGHYPILIGVWEAQSHGSPSVQMWLPERRDGPPIVEGLFGQTLLDERQAFIGASTLEIGEPIRSTLLHEAMTIAVFLQRLGYVGPLSLDALLVGKEGARAEVNWIECNARWSGVSIPMTIARRLDPANADRPLMVVQRALGDRELPQFEAVLARVRPHLWDKDRGSGLMFTEPVGAGGHHLAFFVVAPDRGSCETVASSALDAILGPPAAEGGEHPRASVAP